MKIVVPGRLPDMNEIIAASKKHWSGYSRMKKEHTEAVVWLAKGKPKLRRVILTVTWFEQNLKRDPDNVMAGCKFILDGLVSAGVLENDSQKQVAEIHNYFELDRKNPRIEIEIKEKEE